MVELGQLEERHEDFDGRNVRIVAASLDNLNDTNEMQTKFPHLVLVSDAGRELAGVANVIGPHHSPAGEATVSPTTFIINRSGTVEWIFRPERYIERLSPEDLLLKLRELQDK